MSSPVYVVVRQAKLKGEPQGMYPVMLRVQHFDQVANIGGNLSRALRLRRDRDPAAGYALASIVALLPMAEFSIEAYDAQAKDAWRVFFIDFEEHKLRAFNCYGSAPIGAVIGEMRPVTETTLPKAERP